MTFPLPLLLRLPTASSTRSDARGVYSGHGFSPSRPPPAHMMLLKPSARKPRSTSLRCVMRSLSTGADIPVTVRATRRHEAKGGRVRLARRAAPSGHEFAVYPEAAQSGTRTRATGRRAAWRDSARTRTTPCARHRHCTLPRRGLSTVPSSLTPQLSWRAAVEKRRLYESEGESVGTGTGEEKDEKEPEPEEQKHGVQERAARYARPRAGMRRRVGRALSAASLLAAGGTHQPFGRDCGRVGEGAGEEGKDEGGGIGDEGGGRRRWTTRRLTEGRARPRVRRAPRRDPVRYAVSAYVTT
ncbi:hypothetical protein FB451DRAFT_1405437 [Mycena latifolia]|nr:hypothetical protein FB451DRAFT_1405437 [Mycena latifolia]